MAPYNFVPLPEETIYLDPASLPTYDKYSGLTGYIECQLRTLTPLYTRTAVDPAFYREWGEKIREMMSNDDTRQQYAQFFHIKDAEVPLIPGSTLRGMVRSLVEIVSYSKIQWVSPNRLFFRTMDNSAIGEYYRDRMMDQIEGGLLKYQDHGYFIQKCKVVGISRKLIGSPSDLYEGRSPNRTPHWHGTPSQYANIWVSLYADGENVRSLSYQPQDGMQAGILVITGDMNKKKKEFVFLQPETDAEMIAIPGEMVQRFHDSDQLTQWQEKAFPINQPELDSRQQDGLLRKQSVLSREGDPVFFLRENRNVVFFGRAQMFRLPYRKSPFELVPPQLRSGTTVDGKDAIDFAEAIFGYIADLGRTSSRAGSVSFTNATLDPGQTNVLFDQEITPNILGSPKPTAFQQYLVQSTEEGHEPNRKDTLAHYDSADSETTIRGHKLYWHKKQIDETVDVANWSEDKQHTQIRPVKEGVNFTFRIYFENLSQAALGALLWVLDLPAKNGDKQYRHKLGMGKPRGFGSVQISSKLILSKRTNTVTPNGEVAKGRYGQLLEGDQWFTPERRVKKDQFISQFEMDLLARLNEKERGGIAQLADIPRVAALLKLLEWNPGINEENTRYMTIRPNEYYHRPVLPNAVDVE